MEQIDFTDPNQINGKIEETEQFAPKFDANGLIPAVVTDHQSGRLLMLAYMNRDALAKTLETKDAWYWSRSRRELWRKGATSGNTQQVVDIRTDCDQDAIELVVKQSGPACHTDRPSCFYRSIDPQGAFLSRLKTN